MLKNKVIAEDYEALFRRNVDWKLLDQQIVMITGAYGMLASYIVCFLIWLRLQKGIQVRLILQGHSADKLEKRFGLYANEDIILTDVDILRPIDIKTKPDYILHAAGLANPSYYKTMPIEVAESGALGTYYLLDFAARCETKSFLYFSSGDVYGKFDFVNQDIFEDMMGTVDPLDPHSCYNESKRMGETWCRSFYSEKNVPTKIVRIAHTYSPTMDVQNDPRVFSSFMNNIIHDQNIVMHSDGTACRPYCYVADALVGIFLVLFNGNDGEAYNLCNADQFVSVSELADALINLNQKTPLEVERQHRTSRDYLEATFNRANRLSDAKLKALGWQCEYSIQKGFQRVYNFLCGIK